MRIVALNYMYVAHCVCIQSHCIYYVCVCGTLCMHNIVTLNVHVYGSLCMQYSHIELYVCGTL